MFDLWLKKWQSADQRPKEFVFQTIGRFCYIPFYKIHAYSTVVINNSHTNKNKNKNGKNWLVIYIYILKCFELF